MVKEEKEEQLLKKESALPDAEQPLSEEENEITEEEERFENHPEVIALRKKVKGMSKASLKKTATSLRTEISQHSSKIDQLKKKRADYNAQARHFRAMRNNISDERFESIERLREEAAKEKELRDHCNEQIKLLKKRREELKEELRAAWGKVKELREKYSQVKNEVGIVPEDVTNEIRRLEWEQQTSIISPEEDAEITQRIVELYEKAYAAHLIGFSSEQLDAAIEKAKSLSSEHDDVHQRILSLAEEGQKHHEMMLKTYQELDVVRSDKTGLHEKFLEARELADTTHKNIVEFYERIKLCQFMLDIIDDEQIRRRQEKTLRLKEQRITETKEKRTSGKRLTLDELKLLLGDEEGETEE